MAINTTIAQPARSAWAAFEVSLYNVFRKVTLPAVAAGDSVVLFTSPVACRLFAAALTVPNSLGAGVTAKLQKRDGTTQIAVDITASSTAATAGIVSSTGLVPIDVNAGDTIEVLVSGGASTAGAVAYDVVVQHV